MNVPETLIQLCEKLRNSDHEAYVVGGAIRDMVMNREPHDWDIATDATPEQVKKALSGYDDYRVIDTGILFGTVTALVNREDGECDKYEITTYRNDGRYLDGRHPADVGFSALLDDDLDRRDFTMNAMAWDPLTEELYDPHGGKDDIQAMVIRTVAHPRERFSEDGLRCLRAIRFAAQLGFILSEDIFPAIRQSISTFEKVSMERVSAEFMKMFSCASSVYLARALTYMMECGIIDSLIPEFGPTIGMTQNVYHGLDVYDHTIAVVSHCGKNTDPAVRVAAYFHDIGKPATVAIHPTRGDNSFLGHEEKSAEMCHEIMTRLRFGNDFRDKVCHLIRHHLVMYESKWSNATIRRWIRRVGMENVEPLLALYKADIMGKGNAKIKQDAGLVYELLARVDGLNMTQPVVQSTTQLAINGKDVMDTLDIGPGKEVGNVLKQCLEYVTDHPEENTRDQLILFINKRKMH